MDAAELLRGLVEVALAGSAGLIVVLAVRRPVRRRFGPSVAYAAWWLPLMAMAAVLLPARAVEAPSTVVALSIGEAVALPVTTGAAASSAPTWWCAAWLAGVLACGAWQWHRQRRFVRALGPMRHERDGIYRAASVDGLPATLGLWRPRIVLPADFDTRYDRRQRALMLAHERAHVARGDLLANALVAALRCLFWFNPLVHVAVSRFRHDQELACDQRVLAGHPRARRAYGEAMFNAQLGAQAPLGCHWGYGHPLKERLEMLKRPVPTLARWLCGSALVTVLAAGVAAAAWAAQPARVVAGEAAYAPPAPPPPPAPASMPAPPPPPAPAPPADAPPAPPPPPPPSRPVMPALAPPVYPATAVEQRISGKVVLIVAIDANGEPTSVQVEQSEPAGVFDAAAVAAARQWKFSPAFEGGEPVPSRVRVPVEFRIPPGEAGGGNPAVDLLALENSGAVRYANCDRIVGMSGSARTFCIND